MINTFIQLVLPHAINQLTDAGAAPSVRQEADRCFRSGCVMNQDLSHFVSAVFLFSTHLVFCPCFIVLSSLHSSKHLVRGKAEHSHQWKMASFPIILKSAARDDFLSFFLSLSVKLKNKLVKSYCRRENLGKLKM